MIYFYRFAVQLNGFNVYGNDERTRTFIALQVAQGDDKRCSHLQDIVNNIDKCLQQFRLPDYYKVSIRLLFELLLIMIVFHPGSIVSCKHSMVSG